MKRRRFLKTSAAATVSAATGPFVFTSRNSLAAAKGVSANSMVNHVSIGTNGKAFSDASLIANHPHTHLVAAADVDLAQTSKLKAAFPHIRIYQDWRELFEKEGEKFDSVNVSTPDHMHGLAMLSAMAHGKHVYGQKPLCGTVHEARLVAQAARKTGLVTQMGNQRASDRSNRLAVKLIQQGFIGKVVEIHSFCAKSWGDTEPLPRRTDPVPDSLNWDLWLGVNEPRPYLDGYYHPKNWRRRIGFGVGNMGDMGCHIFHPWFKAIRPAPPLSVRSSGPAPNKTSWPERFQIEYVFPGTAMTAGKTFKATWYDGDLRPPTEIQDLVGGPEKIPGQGSIVIGEAGTLLIPHAENGDITLYPKERFAPFRMPDVRGTSDEHYLQFIDAILGKVQSTRSNFPYAAQMTEAVLLGTIAAFYPGKRLDWNDRTMAFSNLPPANHHLCRHYRKGWTLPVLG